MPIVQVVIEPRSGHHAHIWFISIPSFLLLVLVHDVGIFTTANYMAKESISADANVSLAEDSKHDHESHPAGEIKIESGVNGDGIDPDAPPDGGKDAWIVAFGAFFAYMCSFGWLQCKLRFFPSPNLNLVLLEGDSSG